jgi:DNA-binding transcriptional regulator YiaG
MEHHGPESSDQETEPASSGWDEGSLLAVSRGCPPSQAMAVLGSRLRAWRKAQGLKTECVATDLGIATATWSHWETGTRFPNATHLELICLHTGLTLQELLCPTIERCPFRRR